jgi:hypothetical protein
MSRWAWLESALIMVLAAAVVLAILFAADITLAR